ncbi:fibulin-2-like isoform X1 [Saccostrea cucullata]|uniref:fibulin-2-like isoform X1 n=1 Tax=Saccostrea cuccullata TaxID=36930 RepID=UPI002ED2F546
MKPLVILASLLASSFAVHLSHDLSLHSENLVRMFSDYLLRDDQLQRQSRDVEFNGINEEFKLIRRASSPSYKVQNFAIWYEPASGMRLCETNNTIVFKQCIDTSSNCKYLNSTLQICQKPEAAKNLGCLKTCQLCNHVDKCETGEHNCNRLAECKANGDNFQCTCKKGYEGDGVKSCTDINECTTNTHNCEADQTCKNTEGGFRCSSLAQESEPVKTCTSGYTAQNGKCEDVDECKDPKLNNCHKDALCSNTDGSFKCQCKTGFIGTGTVCIDNDECKGKNDCSSYATCTNTAGSYTCRCRVGFRGNGKSCQDVDECSKGERNNCNKLASCKNSIGSYKCTCPKGYYGDGSYCNDINECSRRSTNKCHRRAKCTNTPGSYKCACQNGYTGDGVTKCNRKQKVKWSWWG